MKRKIKMLLYGAPGIGKSVFANKAEKRFFITTDGNYEYLAEFGAKEEDHKQVESWSEFLKFVKDDDNFKGYDTLVIDLLEDLFMWSEFEFVKKNKLEYIGDLDYGKGYVITRDNFFIEMSKVIAKPLNIILIMHETAEVVKDRRGVESTIYRPSTDIPIKLLDRLEGRMRFVVRAYGEDVENNGRFELKRMLSVTPKPNEYGILRGIDDSHLTEDIPLDYNLFVDLIDSNKISQENIDNRLKKKDTGVADEKVVKPKKVVNIEKVEKVVEEKKEEAAQINDKKLSLQERLAAKKKELEEAKSTKSVKIDRENIKKDSSDTKTDDVDVETIKEEVTVKEPVTQVEKKKDTAKANQTIKVDKMLMIKSKLRAVKLGAPNDKLDKVVNYIVKNDGATDEDIKKYINQIGE